MVFIVILFVLAIAGRRACSLLCPLGIIEELIFKIPFPKKFMELPWEKQLRRIKYVIFFGLVILIPTVFMPNRENLHGIFLFLKLFGFTTVFILSLLIYRPFCKYFCPFGVFLGFFNKISPFRYEVSKSCNQCGLCKRKCKLGLAPYQDPNHMECIRCGECVRRCPKKALKQKNTRGKDR